MAEAKVDIITVDAVTNLESLRNAISDAKKNLSTLQIGSEDYRTQLVELNKAQNLLTNALNGTTAKEEDYDKALKGTSKTYNTLVKQMADMKKELRNIDVSTEEGAASFQKLAGEINAVNDELKAMDAMKGDFQRNVGNYKSAFEGWGAALQAMPGPIGNISKGISGVGDSLALVGKQPILGIIGLLAPLISQIADGLKDNKKALDSLKPIMDFFSGILETVVQYVGDLISQASQFLSSNGIFQKIVQGVVGVGNAILKFIIAPFKGIAAAIKVFQEEGVKGIGNAARAFGAEMKNGVAFKSNFEAGQAFADAIIKGAKSRKKEAAKAGKDLADEVAKAMEKRVKEYAEGVKWRTEFEKYMKGLREQGEKDVEAFTDTIADLYNAEVDAYLASLEREAEEEAFLREAQVEAAKKATQEKLESMQTYASGASGLLNSIADMMEEEGQSAKNLRIAAATIDMISGAVTAFSTAQQLGPIAGPIVGAINAAAVVASGLANIAKIRATQVSADSAPTSSVPAQATVSAPALETSVPTTTVINGSRTETALNRASQPSRVYVVQSDIEAAAQDTRVQVAESSF